MIFDKVIKLIEMENAHWDCVLTDKFVKETVDLKEYMEKSDVIKQIWDNIKKTVYMKEDVNAQVYCEVSLLSKRCEKIING